MDPFKKLIKEHTGEPVEEPREEYIPNGELNRKFHDALDTNFANWTIENVDEVLKLHKQNSRKVEEELKKHNIEKVRVPYEAISEVKYLDILATPTPVMKTKNHMIIILPGIHSHFGVWEPEKLDDNAYPIKEGSAISLVKYLEEAYGVNNAPGLIILNPGEIRWLNTGIKYKQFKFEGNMSYREFVAHNLRNEWSHDVRLGPENSIMRHNFMEQHVRCSLFHIFTERVKTKTEFSWIVLETEPKSPVADLVVENYQWPEYMGKAMELNKRLKAVAWVGEAPKKEKGSEPQYPDERYEDIEHVKPKTPQNYDPKTLQFLRQRSKAWVVTREKVGSTGTGPLGIQTEYVPLKDGSIIQKRLKDAIDFVMSKMGIPKLERAQASGSR